jgi:hypothetical protein
VVLTSSSAHRTGGVRFEDINFQVCNLTRGGKEQEGKG